MPVEKNIKDKTNKTDILIFIFLVLVRKIFYCLPVKRCIVYTRSPQDGSLIIRERILKL